MDVYIRGIEMPKNCDECIYSSWSNFYQIYVCNAIRKNEPVLFDGKQTKSTDCTRNARADNCPLCFIPEPHGRLIDVDALKTAFKEAILEVNKLMQDIPRDGSAENAFRVKKAIQTLNAYGEFCCWLGYVPTIIPASEED